MSLTSTSLKNIIVLGAVLLDFLDYEQVPLLRIYSTSHVSNFHPNVLSTTIQWCRVQWAFLIFLGFSTLYHFVIFAPINKSKVGASGTKSSSFVYSTPFVCSLWFIFQIIFLFKSILSEPCK